MEANKNLSVGCGFFAPLRFLTPFPTSTTKEEKDIRWLVFWPISFAHNNQLNLGWLFW